MKINNITLGTPEAVELAESIQSGELHAHIEEVKTNIHLALQEAPTPELQELQTILGRIRVYEDKVNAYIEDGKQVPTAVLQELANALAQYEQHADVINNSILENIAA